MRSMPSSIGIFFLTLFFLACHSPSEPASAHTSGGFHDDPITPASAPLIYDTLSPSSRNIIGDLDKYYKQQVRAGFNGSVLVGYKGKIIYERYFGLSNRERRMPLTTNSSCQLA